MTDESSVLSYDFTASKNQMEADGVALQLLDKYEKTQAEIAQQDIVQQSTSISEISKNVVDIVNAPVKKDRTLMVQELQDTKTKLAEYKKKVNQTGHIPFGYSEEIAARKKAQSAVKLASGMMKWHSADDATFDSMLKTSGDFEEYTIMKENTLARYYNPREDFTNRKAMELMGFSEREISSGFAEPQLREAIKAGEEESTFDAVSRWGQHVLAEDKRQKEVAVEASNNAISSFMGMKKETQKQFEDQLEEKFSKLSDTERLIIRKANNVAQLEMEKQAGHLKPYVKKAFNTISRDSGTPMVFEGDEPFATLEEASLELAKLGKDDFGMVVTMMAETAKANGQNIDTVMGRFSNSWGRATKGFADLIDAGYVKSNMQEARKLLASNEDVWVWDTNKKGDQYDTLRELSGASPLGRGKYSPTEYQEADWLPTVGDGNFKKRKLTQEERKNLLGMTDKMELAAAYGTQLNQWRDVVAKVKTTKNFWGKWNPENWAYYTIDSLPEMALSMSNLTLPLVYAAQTERNLADLRAQAPEADWEKLNSGAQVAALAYTALSKVQAELLFKNMPKAKSFIGKFVSTLALETVTEFAQDGMMPVTQKIYAAIDEDMPDVNLFGEGGRLNELIMNSPEVAFGMIPIVLVGVGGKSVGNYLDRRALNGNLANPELLAALGLAPEDIEQMSEMALDEKMSFVESFVKEHGFTRISNPADQESIATSSSSKSDASIARLSSVLNFNMGEDVDTQNTSSSIASNPAVMGETSSNNGVSTPVVMGETSSNINAPSAAPNTSSNVASAPTTTNVVNVSPVENLHAWVGKASDDTRNIVFTNPDTNVQETMETVLSQMERIDSEEQLDSYIDWLEQLPNQTPELASAIADIRKSFVATQQAAPANGRTQNSGDTTKLGGQKTSKKLGDTPAPLGVAPNVKFIATPDGKIVVTNGEKSVTTSGAAEAAEVALSMNPEGWATTDTIDYKGAPQTLQEATTESFLAGAVLDNPAAYGHKIGAQPIRWTLEVENVGNVRRAVAHPELTKAAIAILKAIGSTTAIRFGKKKVGKNANGSYWLAARIIRVRRNGGVTTVFHEVGHAIEDQFLEGSIGDNKWVKIRKISNTMRVELAHLGTALYGNAAPANTLLSEGFAEYTRMLLEGVHDMADIAPATHAWFTTNVLDANPKVAKAYAKLQKLSKDYASQGALNRGYAGIVGKPNAAQVAALNFSSFVETLASKYVDALYPLKDITQEAISKYRGRGKLSVDPFATATQLAATHDAVVKGMVENEHRDWVGNGFGKKSSLKYILANFNTKQRRKNLSIYLWARRTLAIAAWRKDKYGNMVSRESGLSLADANHIIKELGTPEFETTAQKIYEWNDRVLQYAADSSADYAEVVARIRKHDAGDYIPLFREFEAIANDYSNRPPNALGGALVKHLTGSSRRIKDPFESMIHNARGIVLRANQRAVIEQLLTLIKHVPDMSNVIFEVEIDKIPDAHRSVVDMLEAITKEIEDGDSLDALEDAKEKIARADEGDKLITFWGEAYMPTKQTENPIIPIFFEGKRRWFEVNRVAYDAIMGMETFRIDSPLFNWIIAKPNQLFKLGTTGYRASFAMATNPARDFSTLYYNTRSNASFFRILGTWANTMKTNLIAGLSGDTLMNDKWRQLYHRLGLEMASSLGADLNHTQDAADRLFHGKIVRLRHPNEILNYVRGVFQYAESATRITEMKLIAREIGWNPKTDALTPEIAQKLMIAAKEVTTNFSAAGSKMRFLNQVMPFSNAQVQGIRSHYDAFRRNKLTFGLKMLVKAGIAASLWMWYKDEEWWIQMPASEKYRFTYIPVSIPMPDGSTREELLRIPRAFEMDGLAMAMPMAILDSLHQNDPEAAKEMALMMMGSLIPTTMPVAVAIPYELGANEDTFFDRKIIPADEERLSVDGFRKLQYGSHNTKLSIKLGEIFDVSPREVDHVIRKSLGGAGMDFVALFGRGSTPVEETEFNFSDIPVVGTFFSPMGRGSFAPKSVTELYEYKSAAEANLAAGSITGDKETVNERQARLMLKDAAATLGILNEVSKLKLKVNEKREIDKMKVTVAKEAVEAYENHVTPATRAKVKKYSLEATRLQNMSLKETAQRAKEKLEEENN
jgi:hypothetical protein